MPLPELSFELPITKKGIWPKCRLWSEQLADLVGPVLFLDLDLVVTSDPIDLPGVQYLPLFQYEAKLVVDRYHDLLKQAWVEPSDLSLLTACLFQAQMIILTQATNYFGS